ncbi:MAG: hypothetical protein M3Q18_07480 [Actinomycetota bacterium]|nr:hypothetical protein [Actinomycetota bacterium]
MLLLGSAPRGADERWLFELQLWVLSQGASSWLAELEPYERTRVAGGVETLRLDPLQGRIEASVTDGTAAVVARWSIRRPTPELAVAPGRRVVLEGTTAIGEAGEVILQEPAFQVFESAGACVRRP